MGLKNKCGLFNGTNGTKENHNNVKENDIQPLISSKGEELLNKATDIGLINTIKELYRPGSHIGDGGTADAIAYEIKTGFKVDGKSHIKKGYERIKNLERILKKESLNTIDREIAEQLLKELKKALGGE